MALKTVKIILFVLFGLWAGFWGWFSIASVVGEPGGWGHMILPLGPILLSAILLIRNLRVGGIVLALFGVGGLFLYGFKFPVTAAGLSGAAIVLGTAFALLGSSKLTGASKLIAS